MSRYLQRLEKELAKYKSELEADNEGITEVLEQMAMKEVNTELYLWYLLQTHPYISIQLLPCLY